MLQLIRYVLNHGYTFIIFLFIQKFPSGSKPHDYGRQRLWGAIGWGVMAIFAGYLIDMASLGKTMKDYTPSFILVFIMLSINAISVSKIKVCISSRISVKHLCNNIYFLMALS